MSKICTTPGSLTRASNCASRWKRSTHAMSSAHHGLITFTATAAPEPPVQPSVYPPESTLAEHLVKLVAVRPERDRRDRVPEASIRVFRACAHERAGSALRTPSSGGRTTLRDHTECGPQVVTAPWHRPAPRPSGDAAQLQAVINYCALVPVAVDTSVALRPWLPGHHARNQPLAQLAVTRVPSFSLSVTPVTPAPVRPTTIENCREPSSAGVVVLPEERRTPLQPALVAGVATQRPSRPKPARGDRRSR